MVRTYRNIKNIALRPRARELRHEQTPAEQKLWQALRGRAAGGLKFRRQVPFGSYIVDFYCAEAKLVVEVDGDVHDTQVEYDPRHCQGRRGQARNEPAGWSRSG